MGVANCHLCCRLGGLWNSQKDAWNYSLEGLGEIAKYSEELGITLVVDPPPPADTNLIETADDALLLSEQTGASNVKVMFDTFHALSKRSAQ